MESAAKRTLPVIATAVLLATMLGWLAAGESSNSPTDSERVREILNERLEVLTAIAKLQRQGYQSGETDLASVLAAEADVLSAKLELANTSEERIAILEQTVENARQLEEVTHKLLETRSGSRVDALKAKAFRLRAEADLLRTRSTAKP